MEWGGWGWAARERRAVGGQRWGTKWVRAESLLDTQEGDHGHHGALERETPPSTLPKQREKGGRDRYGRKRKQRLHSAIAGVCGFVEPPWGV